MNHRVSRRKPVEPGVKSSRLARASGTAAVVLVALLYSPGCGGRSSSEQSATTCATPDSFPKADGELADCRVVDVVACEARAGGITLCPGTDASQCGSSVDPRAQCAQACSQIGYALS